MDYRDKIFSQSEELFMRYGIKSVTMDDISKELGISKKTLYQAVDNKADLIRKIIGLHIDREKEAIGVIQQESEDAMEEMMLIARYVSQMLRKIGPTVIYDLKKYYRGSYELMESLHQQYISSVIKDNIQRGIRQKIYRQELNVDIISKLYVTTSFLVVNNDVFPVGEYNREQLYWEFIRYHIRGIASVKGLELFKKYSNTKSQ